jgi:uncharacterized membrane protein
MAGMALKIIMLTFLILLSVGYLLWYRKKISLRWDIAFLLRLVLVALILVGFYFSAFVDVIEAQVQQEILILDLSDSISDQELLDAQEFSLDWVEDQQNRSVIVFGVEFDFLLGEDWPDLLTSGSNLEEALQAAVNLIGDQSGRILIATDGSVEAPAAIISLLAELTSAGIAIDVIQLGGTGFAKDIYIQTLDVPDGVWSDSDITVEVGIFSPEKGAANLGFSVNGELQGTTPLEVRPGINEFAFEMNSGEAGILILEATIKWEGERFDPFVTNNTLYASMEVYPPPHVLLVSSETDQAFRLLSNLRAEGLNIEMVSPQDLPNSLSELAQYQAILMVNVLAQQLSYEQMLGLETFVVDFGRALIFFGGRSSFNLGGYEDTLLEPLLPVDLTPPERIERVPATYVMVLDRSGSMLQDESTDISPMDLTKEAAIRAMESLRPDDYLGVLTFSSSFSWAVPIGEVGDGMSLRLAQDAISQVQAAGGTLISAALEEAIAQIIQSSPTEYRHILLMSDGSGDEEYDTLDQFSVLAAIAQRQNTTISTIALGRESDPETMELIANEGNGRFYEVLDPTDLPGVMVAESKAAHSESIQLGLTNLISGISNHPVLSGFNLMEIPQIQGYNAVSSKADFGAENILVSANFGDPILSSWQVGLGHVAAWMTDLGAEWAPSFENWRSEGAFWKRIIYYSLPDPSFNLTEIEVTEHGEDLSIKLNVYDYSGSPVNTLKPEFVYLDLDGELVFSEMRQVGIGEYQTSISRPAAGGYRGVIRYSIDETSREVGVPFTVNYPKEWAFDYSGGGKATLESWSAIAGVNLTMIEDEMNPETENGWLEEINPFSAIVVILIVIWPLEIGLRRWKMPWRRP